MATKRKANPALVRFCAWCKHQIDTGNLPFGESYADPKAEKKLRQAREVTDTICTPCYKREFGKEPPQRVRPNPRGGRELVQAAQLSQRFHGFAPRRLTHAPIRWPRALAHLGPCLAIDYHSDKFSGKPTRYFHEFTGRCDVFAAPRAMPDGDSLLVVKGNFKVKAEGLTG